MLRRLLISAIVAVAALAASAQAATDSVVRPVASAYSLELGCISFRDTYLTPVEYSGWNAALTYERMQAMKFDPERWIMRLDARLNLASTTNPSGGTSMYSANFRPSWSMMRRFRLRPELTVAVGGNLGGNLGGLYIMRSGNNPASVQASLTLGLTGMATYAFSLGKLPITLRYQPTMPLTGLFFSPDYNQLYYEIWLGNHSGLCHFATPANFFRLDNLLTADLHFGSTTLRLGYRCELFSSKASSIVSRHTEHSFVLGIVTEWLSLRSHSRRTPDARIISSIY